ncbi:MAG: PAS domain S-box protein [Gammaproteobacteria bacterium]|nr:MAG: PAS domain S-box protein [Gammaproteobacteria bacterium]
MARILLLSHKESAARRQLVELLGVDHEVVEASGAEALAEPFDLGIIDVAGLEQFWREVRLRKIREQPDFLPFLLLTAREEHEPPEEQMRYVIDDLIFTPIEPRELRFRLHNLLSARQHALVLERDIRARAQGLSESERRYREFMESLPVAAYAVDAFGRLSLYNEAAVKLWGRQPGPNDRWCGAHKLFTPEGWYLPHNDCPAAVAFRENRPIHGVEAIIERPDGTRVNVLVNINPIRDAAGQRVGVTNVILDITERKRAEEAMRDSETKFSVLFDQAPFAAALFRLPEGAIVEANEAFTEVFGYSREEVLGRTTTELGFEPDPKTRVRMIAEFRNYGFSRAREVTLRAKSGEPRNILVNLDRIEFGGRVYVLGTCQDITARKRAETERDRLFNLSLDMLCIAGMDGFFKQLNPAWGRTLGWSDAELHSRPWLEFVHPDDREETVRALGQLIDGQAVHAFENRYRRSDGSYRWVSWNAFPLPDERLIFAVARDITAGKFAAAALRESEVRFSTLFEKAPYPAALVRLPEYVFVEINQAFEETYGFTKAEILGKGTLEMGMITGEARERLIREADVNLTLRDHEVSVRTKSGERRTILLNSDLVEIGGVRYSLSTSLDITARKRGMAVRERLTQIIEAATDFIGIADRQGRIHYINRAGRRLLGIGLDEDVTCLNLKEFHPPELFGELGEQRTQQIAREGFWEGETVFLTRDGRELLLWQVILAHPAANGEEPVYSTISRVLPSGMPARTG